MGINLSTPGQYEASEKKKKKKPETKPDEARKYFFPLLLVGSVGYSAPHLGLGFIRLL